MTAPQLQHKRHPSHRGVFFRNRLQDPFHVASIAPSGRLLAKLMASDVRSGARVVELGAGTGTLTQALVDAGVRSEDLYLIDQNVAFVEILRARFPHATVLQANAAELATRLSALAGTVDYVVSGLPILWFDKDTKTRILEQAFSLLRKPGGCFHQFTYLGCPPVGSRILDRLGLTAALIGVSPINLPPAFVYRLQRAA